MSILFTEIVRVSDRRVLVSAESVFSRHFETKHRNTMDEISRIPETFENETQFCSTKSSDESIMIYFKRFEQILIISAVEIGLSKTSISLYFEKIRDLFLKEYSNDLSKNTGYIRFEDTIKEESKRYSQDKGLEDTFKALKETKEVCIKNYTNVLQRGHKIEQLEALGQKLQTVSEQFRKKSKKMHVEAVITQYVFYVVIIIILFLILYYFQRK
ncbi:vesicle transport protein SEC22 [Nematocida sp. AWRm80]|nr:vesicle transport protein SEC22 [Nematocida sp. AWRm80]